MLCGVPDGPGLIVPEHFERCQNRVMLFHAVTQAMQQNLLEHVKPFLRSSCFTKALPQPAGRRSPECFQIDVSAGEIAGRKSEEGKRATRFEVNSDDRYVFRGNGNEAAPMRA